MALALPLALVSAVAMVLHPAAPAEAQAATKKPAKAKDQSGRGALTKRAAQSAPAPHTYTVVEGDTVADVAARFGLPTASVLAMNGLGWSTLIFPGQTLVLADAAPEPVAAPAAAGAGVTHTVASGDTVSGIADAYGVSTAAVLAANGLDESSTIFPGQSIIVPDGVTAAAESAAPLPSSVPAEALTDEMRENARTIIAVGREVGADDAALVVALATAAQESGLLNLDHGDRDSLGLFQQRPSTGWGSPDQVMDATYATRAFFQGAGRPGTKTTRGLFDIDGWESMSVNDAAQAVQISAFPNHYAKWEASARRWLEELG
ncbi:LysM domain-containing protein [Cryobacterium tepidiphilum]|uniref:LysM domain-containing protein n=2 Tax=Cryobacterium tepidiphilum TaxID=2486026 RepID=A0A3M8L232_9MICO|nr:LysM domain-containing protein [Cryobacterium tepidiphilum]